VARAQGPLKQEVRQHVAEHPQSTWLHGRPMRTHWPTSCPSVAFILRRQSESPLTWGWAVSVMFVSVLRHHVSHVRHAHGVCRVSWFSGSFTALIIRRVVEWPCESTPTPDTAVVAFALVTDLQPNDECPAATTC
jgi:hypothetical protein